ncbi:cobalamin biosynthesis protein [Halomonas sp. EGI 63088]|uniref:Cobalamin biosynthesis protein n=1 Tax=Halomonas flagellata TaxID=2920385 RepID=A0ABS9RPS7_9GAMM|nr:cobalamin biosynthesis protein [Halomonas flagellata]MCH4561555.1 cobalamin biosynthesis protein [Halomonas flagellata]
MIVVDDSITVAGFGFRRGALLASLIDALDRLHEHYGAVDRLAATRTMWPLVQELGRVRGIAVILVADAALPTAITITRSRHSWRARGTGSVAEAVALLAAGSGAALLGPRLISMDRLATAAVARAPLGETA